VAYLAATPLGRPVSVAPQKFFAILRRIVAPWP
jgi:hypothetical protein